MFHRILLVLSILLLPALLYAECTPAQLQTELTTDPQTLGYAAFVSSGNDVALLDLLNQVRAGGAYQINRGRIPAYEVAEAFDDTEYAALTELQLRRLNTLLSPGQVNFAKTNVRNILRDIFPVSGPTRTALTALAQRQGSRAEVLCGSNRTLRDISLALRNSQ